MVIKTSAMNSIDLGFRHLIKTLVPGCPVVICIIVILNMALKFVDKANDGVIYNYISNFPLISGVVLIPLSVAVGLIMNAFVFLHMFRPIIKQFDNRNKNFLKFEKKIVDVVYAHYYKYIYDDIECEKMEEMKKHTKISSLLLCKKGVGTIEYIKNNYWYYMEFHLNFIITIIFITFTSVVYIISSDFIRLKEGMIGIFVIGLVALLLVRFLRNAAYVNYQSYKKQELSVIIGAYHICLEDEG